MSREINITVKNRIAAQTDDTVYVCGNKDYTVVFDFDGDWADLAMKTARFRYNGEYQDIVFEGDSCPMPQISNTHIIKVGVYAGDLRTTTPALVSARKSVLCEGGAPADPPEDVYHQIMERLNDIEAENSKEMGGVKVEIEGVQEELKNSANTANTELEALRKDLDELRADFEYVPIDITGISNSVGTVEIGTAVDAVTVTWGVNKDPASQTINGGEIAANLRRIIMPYDGTNKFTVKVTDERGATDSADTSVSFLRSIYFGALDAAAVIDSAAILSMRSKLSSTPSVSFTVTPGAGQKLAYAQPSGYREPKFNIGGFDYVWTKVTPKPVQHTNASGHTEDYDVWMNDDFSTGEKKVTVS